MIENNEKKIIKSAWQFAGENKAWLSAG